MRKKNTYKKWKPYWPAAPSKPKPAVGVPAPTDVERSAILFNVNMKFLMKAIAFYNTLVERYDIKFSLMYVVCGDSRCLFNDVNIFSDFDRMPHQYKRVCQIINSCIDLDNNLSPTDMKAFNIAYRKFKKEIEDDDKFQPI